MIKKTIKILRLLPKVINYILISAIFCLAAFLIVSYSAGYKVDLKNRNIKPTGILEIVSQTPDAQISVDDKIVGYTSVALRNIEPKTYKITISKNDYQTWTKSVDLKGGEAVTLNNIVLFKQKPLIEEYSSNIKAELISELADTDSLKTANGEIYQNGALVTRLLSDVYGVCWYPNRNYIAFTSSEKLMIVDIDGANLVEITAKTSKTPVIFINSGRSIIFENEGKIYRGVIR